MFGDVLAFHERLTVWEGAAVPVPVKVSVVVGGWALLVTVSVPLAAPTVCGLNVIVKGTLWPAAIVTGSERPPTLNTELFELAPVTVTFAPLAVRLPDEVPLVPAMTLPRSIVVGATVSCPTAAAPVPDRAILSVELEALDVTVTAPLALPADVGANAMVKVAPWPAISVTGVVMPLRLYPVPLVAT